MSSARGPWRPPGVGGTFRAVDLFATATGVAARCCQRDGGLWIVGLLHAPPLLFHRRRKMAAGSCEGHPAIARLGSGRPMPGPRGLRLSIGDTVRLALPALASVGPVRPCGRRGRLRRCAGSSLGVVKVRPSIGIGAWCPLRVIPLLRGAAAGPFPRELALQRGATFGPELPNSGLVPPLPFLPAATVCSTWHLSGLLHPETDPGVRHVSGRAQCASPACLPRDESLGGRAAASAALAGCLGRPRSRGPGAPVPEGPVALVASRRGEHAAASYPPRWRVTLRSFPLVASCTASVVLAWPHLGRRVCPGRVRVVCDALGVDRPAGPIHRGRCPLAVTRWEA
jgi:hypothetical protein